MFKGMFKKTKYVPISMEEMQQQEADQLEPEVRQQEQEQENSEASATELTEDEGDQPTVPEGLFIKCKICRKTIYRPDFEENLFVCPECGKYHRVYAKSRIRMIIDEGTFEQWDGRTEVADPLHFPGYPEKIESLKEELKMDEAVVTGYGKIFGRQTAIAVMDARFMMASMGSVVGEKITSAIERATKEKLPVIIFSCSGGARMQEGMISLMQMAKTSAALRRHADAGLPYFSVITDPTTGGVTASFASLGDVILAEPGCLIGFAGQRVIEQTIFQKLPKGFQSAEFALEHGIIDAIVERKDMKKALSRLLELHMPYVPEEKKEEGE